MLREWEGERAYSRQFFGNLYVRKDFLFLIPCAQDLFILH